MMTNAIFFDGIHLLLNLFAYDKIVSTKHVVKIKKLVLFCLRPSFTFVTAKLYETGLSFMEWTQSSSCTLIVYLLCQNSSIGKNHVNENKP